MAAFIRKDTGSPWVPSHIGNIVTMLSGDTGEAHKEGVFVHLCCTTLSLPSKIACAEDVVIFICNMVYLSSQTYGFVFSFFFSRWINRFALQ